MRALLFIICGVLMWGCTQGKKQSQDRILVTVKRNYDIPKTDEPVTIVMDVKDIEKYLGEIHDFGLHITDQNWGNEVNVKYIDTNDDSKIDVLILDYILKSKEPVYTFLMTRGNKKSEILKGVTAKDERFSISYLTPFKLTPVEESVSNIVSKKIAESTLNMYPDVNDFPVYNPRKWNYEYSFFLAGCFRLGKKVNQPSYINYAQTWIDDFITPEGGLKDDQYNMEEYKLDDIIPGRLALFLYEDTKDEKYKSIVDTLRLHLAKQPKTSDGGYWHKKIYPHQMWLDGIFMGDVFAMQYARDFNVPDLFDDAAHQIKLVYKHTLDSITGLMYHGWDESKSQIWANPQRGTSPEFWARAMGWYAMALVECLDYLPTDHPDREDIIAILKKVSSSILKYQDGESHLWYQVLDKGANEGNWIETSASAMFAYAFAKGNRLGYLDNTYLESANKAYDALLDNYVYEDSNGNIHFDQTVIVGTLNPKTSNGSYLYYVSSERRINDYKGLASLLFASIELNR